MKFSVNGEKLAVISLLVSSLTTSLPFTLCSNQRVLLFKYAVFMVLHPLLTLPLSGTAPLPALALLTSTHVSGFPWVFSLLSEMFPFPAPLLFQSQSKNTRLFSLDGGRRLALASLSLKAYLFKWLLSPSGCKTFVPSIWYSKIGLISSSVSPET